MALRRFARRDGLSMIEVMCAIVIISSLAATAYPQFFDFSTEGKKAAVQYVIGNLDSAIQIQKKNMMLKCGAPSRMYPTTDEIASNKWLYDKPGLVLDLCIPDARERRFLDANELPVNPFNNNNLVYSIGSLGISTPEQQCSFVSSNILSASSGSSGSTALRDAGYGWVYDDGNGNFFAATGYADECGF